MASSLAAVMIRPSPSAASPSAMRLKPAQAAAIACHTFRSRSAANPLAISSTSSGAVMAPDRVSAQASSIRPWRSSADRAPGPSAAIAALASASNSAR